MFTAEQIEMALMQPTLTLADVEGYSQLQLRALVIEAFELDDVQKAVIAKTHFVVAYQSVGDFGCDSSAYYLVMVDGKFFEVHASHCSCMGFEEQWEPCAVTPKYLVSPQWHMSTGGYDDDSGTNRMKVQAFLQKWFSKLDAD